MNSEPVAGMSRALVKQQLNGLQRFNRGLIRRAVLMVNTVLPNPFGPTGLDGPATFKVGTFLFPVAGQFLLGIFITAWLVRGIFWGFRPLFRLLREARLRAKKRANALVKWITLFILGPDDEEEDAFVKWITLSILGPDDEEEGQ